MAAVEVSDVCPICSNELTIDVEARDIPNYKPISIFKFDCDACGHKSLEMKGIADPREKGETLTLTLSDQSKWEERMIIKSQTASLEIPEVGIEIPPGTAAGRVGSVEDLLHFIKDQLVETGSNLSGASKTGMLAFLALFTEVIAGERDATIVMRDISGNSYLEEYLDADGLDPYVDRQRFERTAEENALLESQY